MKLILNFIGNKYIALGLLLFCTYLFLKPSSGNSIHIISDKVAHAIIFFSLFITWAFFTKKPSTVLLGFLTYGICIEIIQYLLPISFHRGFEFFDILADACGLIIGFGFYNLAIKKGDLN
jgi:VanZ family protein